MLMFTLAIYCLHFQFALIHGPNFPGSYAILLFTASDFTSITSHIHNWVLFLLWLRLFILSGVSSPLISSSILGTYQPGKFIFQCPIFLPFHTVHGFSRQEYWSALSFPSPVDHILSELSTMTHTSWVALQGMGHSFIELDKAAIWSDWLVFCDCSFQSVCSLIKKNKRLMKARECTGHSKHPLPTTQEKTLHMDITRWSTLKSDWLYFLQPKIEKLYTVSKNKTGSWLWLRSWTPYCQIQT